MRLFFTVLLLACSAALFAQHKLGTVVVPDSTVKTEIPDSPPPPRTSHRAIIGDSVNVAFKCSPVLLLTGELPVFVEFRLNRYYSIEAAAGVTYTDLLYESAVNNGFFLGNKNAKFHSGYALRAQGRLFPRHEDVAISGYYIGPEVTYRTYKMDWNEFTGLLYDVYPAKRTVSEFRFVAGWQNAENQNEAFIDVYFAAGIRQVWEKRTTEIPNAEIPEPYRIVPNFGFGLKFGWGM